MEKHTMLNPSAAYLAFFFIFFISWTICATETINVVKAHDHHRNAPNSSKLFVFGDSFADTGNSPKSTAISWKEPYGVTFPGKPSGRFSDGHILTDYLASFLGVSSPIPFYQWLALGEKSTLENGLNFAHGGTGVFTTLASGPNMTAQINIFQQLVQQDQVYTEQDLSSSVALVSVAGNDYAAYFAQNGTIQDAPTFIKSIMSQLVLDLQKIHGLGVQKVGVTAMHPLGCLPVTTARISHKSCSEEGNSLAKFHNQMLRENIDELNNGTGSSVFVILDLYSAFQSALNLPDNETDEAGNSTIEDRLSPCCVGTERGCSCGSVNDFGRKKYIVCQDLKHFFWDDIHPSQQGWEAVYSALKPSLQGLLH